MVRNFMAREVNAKVVFWGPTGSGKKTAMQHYVRFAPPRGKVHWTDDVEAALRGGAVLFDFLPPNGPVISGFTVRLHLCTLGTPEDPERAAEARAFVAKDADAVVFVADSERARQTANAAAMRALEADLALARLPTVLLYNKRDLPDVASVADMNAALNPRGRTFFEGNAVEGLGVHAATKEALALAILPVATDE